MPDKKKLLIVDDELFIRELLDEYFTKQSYEVDLAESGGAALSLLGGRTYDVALVDFKMPEMNGIELLRLISERGHQMPFILMTGYPTVNSVVSALRQGAFDYIVKPFRLNELSTIVTRALLAPRVEVDQEVLKEKIALLRQENLELKQQTMLALQQTRRREFAFEQLADTSYSERQMTGEVAESIIDGLQKQRRQMDNRLKENKSTFLHNIT